MASIAPINYIELRESRLFGTQAVITGHGIAVHNLVAMYIIGQSPIEWICENFDLTPAQVYAALSYYYDHREQIDREIQAADALAARVGSSAEEELARFRARQAEKK